MINSYYLISIETYKFENHDFVPITRYGIVINNSLVEYEKGLFSFDGVLLNELPSIDEVNTILKFIHPTPMLGFTNIKLIK